MFNFNKLVTNILLEADVFDPTKIMYPPGPTWFVGLLNKHKELGLGDVTPQIINKIFNIASKGYISGQDAKSVEKYILILDVFRNIWEKSSPKPARTLLDFFKNESVNKFGEQEYNVISNYKNKNQWEITNASVANALEKQPGKSRLGYVTQALGALAAFGGAKLYG